MSLSDMGAGVMRRIRETVREPTGGMRTADDSSGETPSSRIR
jgi:hypothetical protein